MKTPITVAYGDGIGPEIMQACLHVLDIAGTALDIETHAQIIDLLQRVTDAGPRIYQNREVVPV